MKQCPECDPHFHDGGCNWLDYMVKDGLCPHCRKPLVSIGRKPIDNIMEKEIWAWIEVMDPE